MADCYARSVVFLSLFVLTNFSFTHPFVVIANHHHVHDHTNICKENEKQALLSFKRRLVDQTHFISSWRNEGEDCCASWVGVHCDNLTNHVVKLDLRCSSSDPCLSGNIDHSLLELSHLTYLDLSGNAFVDIPPYIGSFGRLMYLNLSHISYPTPILLPKQVANLTSLQILDLSYCYNFTVANFEWASSLSSLKQLDLTQDDLSSATDWLRSISGLSFLSSLRLASCSLPQPQPLPSSYSNISNSLRVLDLSSNDFNSSIYSWLVNITSRLVYLDLSWSNFSSPIPNLMGNIPCLKHLDLSSSSLIGQVSAQLFKNLRSLEFLDLSQNQFVGHIPQSLGNISALGYVNLFNNSFEGSVPDQFWGLCNLQTLNLASNKLSGELPVTLWNLTSRCTNHRLETIDMSSNALQGAVPDLSVFSSLRVLNLNWNNFTGLLPNITRISSLRELHLASNNFDSGVLHSIWQLYNLTVLDVSSNSLHGSVTEFHLQNLFGLQMLDLSNNLLSFYINDSWTPPFQLSVLVIGGCHIGPRFPDWLRTQTNLSSIDISHSGISDTIPGWFWKNLGMKLNYLNMSYNTLLGTLPDEFSLDFMFFSIADLSFNNLSGTVPPSFLKSTVVSFSNNLFSGSISSMCTISSSFIEYLDLSNNLLSGELPDCWENFQFLFILNLADNAFHGKIPDSLGSLNTLQGLHLRNNKLQGEIPSSLRSCSALQVMDLMGNNLSGNLPTWLNERQSSLFVVSFRSNNLSGSIPSSICELQHINVLDLSLNHLSGTIPSCLNRLSSLSSKSFVVPTYWQPTWTGLGYNINDFVDSVILDIKGIDREYISQFGLIKLIDLSSNKLSGDIPQEIISLVNLISLNLSRNCLIGPIPSNIGKLYDLETLDLSRNRLSGEIPPSLSSLSYLGNLDLSRNYLSGRIPLGTQLQGFNSSVYEGNPGLCGPPLPRCPGDQRPSSTTIQDVKDHESQEESEDDDGNILSLYFYISMAIGFPIGFWVVFGPFIICGPLQNAYLRWLSRLADKLCLMIEVTMANSSRKRRH